MPIVPAGSLNTTALTVPDLYVQIVPPQPQINGVPSNIIGVVGGASWGPLNKPTVFGNYAEYQSNFGPVQNTTFDMGTAVAIMVQQGASSFCGVRVSDGTDVAATIAIGSAPVDITFNALYTGTTGNSVSVSLAPGGATASWNATVALPGVLTELFSNITGTGAAFWTNLAAAINNGQGALRGPSQLISATTGTGVTAPTVQSVTLTGGLNGTSTLTTAMLVGTDGTTRTGMYALRKQGCAIAMLADASDVTQWTTQNAFAEAEGLYMMLVLPSGTTIATAVTDVQGAGIDSYACKIMHGDWLYWYDQVNGLRRLVSPQAFVAGKLGALDPSQSTLNKPLNGVIGSQTFGLVGSSQQHYYSSADLSALFVAGIDVITNPAPGGPYWAVRGGINSSLNAAVNGDNYTTMTDYLAATLDAGMGEFVGMKITTTMDREAVATIASFLSTLQQQGLLGSPTDPPPFTVTGGLGPNTPNPQSRTALGYYQINVAVTYSPINRFFIINLQGGQTVVTSKPL